MLHLRRLMGVLMASMPRQAQLPHDHDSRQHMLLSLQFGVTAAPADGHLNAIWGFVLGLLYTCRQLQGAQQSVLPLHRLLLAFITV
jgi:hypothetical protein